jgi:hypothetical protein
MKTLRKTILFKEIKQHVYRKLKLDSLKNVEYSKFDFKTTQYRPGEGLRTPEGGGF